VVTETTETYKEVVKNSLGNVIGEIVKYDDDAEHVFWYRPPGHERGSMVFRDE